MIISLPDGSTYSGDIKDGLPHGQGTANYLDGSRYFGGWKDGKKHGRGTTIFVDGNIENAEWIEGQRVKCDEISSELLSERGTHKENKTEHERKFQSDISSGIVPQVRPWARWAARLIDVSIFAIVFSWFYIIIMPPETSRSFFESDEITLNMIFFGLWVFVEPAFLSTWGTTLGKWLFNTKVRDIRGNKITYSLALSRSIRVWIYGLALGIPLLNLITMFLSYKGLSNIQKTAWDATLDTRVLHGNIDTGRVVLIIIVISLLVINFIY